MKSEGLFKFFFFLASLEFGGVLHDWLKLQDLLQNAVFKTMLIGMKFNAC